MSQDWTVPAWGVLVAAVAAVLLVLALGLFVRSTRRRMEAQLALTTRTAEALGEQIALLERRLAPDPGPAADRDASEAADYVITRVGDLRVPDDDHEGEGSYEPLPRAVFADLVLRETAVRAVGLTAGLRRALDPQTRNRIRFEMKQEVKRSRKQRKADLRVARREWEARQRAAGAPPSDPLIDPREQTA